MLLNANAIRSLLFTPGNRSDRFLKAQEMGADGVIIDLEDSVSLPEKDNARTIALNYFLSYQKNPKFIQALRINSPKTRAGINDIAALINQDIRPDILVIPKVEYPGELHILDEVLSPLNIPYMPMIESAIGLRNVTEIARSSQNVCALIFGGGDLSVDLGAAFEWEPLLTSRCAIVRAAAEAGICALDVPYIHFKDPDDSKITEETRRVKALGFTGKLAIHPKHIAPINTVFTPSVEEVEHAQKVVSAYNAANGNACVVDGAMIDVPIYHLAQRVLARVR